MITTAVAPRRCYWTETKCVLLYSDFVTLATASAFSAPWLCIPLPFIPRTCKLIATTVAPWPVGCLLSICCPSVSLFTILRSPKLPSLSNNAQALLLSMHGHFGIICIPHYFIFLPLVGRWRGGKKIIIYFHWSIDAHHKKSTADNCIVDEVGYT